MISSVTTHGLPSVLHGVQMDSRSDIVSALCKLSQEGEKEKLADFLRDERANRRWNVTTTSCCRAKDNSSRIGKRYP